MVKKMYSVCDQKSELFLPPFLCHTDGDAMRQMQSVLNDPKSMLSAYPSDFALYRVGAWDDEKGVLLPVSPSFKVVELDQLVQKGVSRE